MIGARLFWTRSVADLGIDDAENVSELTDT